MLRNTNDIGENMQNTTLLESIWQGDIFASKCRRSHEIVRLLRLVLPLDFVHFTARSGIARSCIIPEHIELLPEIHLGDVLAEELDANVPFGAMVVVFKERDWTEAATETNESYELGVLIGDLLVSLINDCVFPLQSEMEVLSVMANSYYRLIKSPECQEYAVCSQSFHEGLMFSLEEYCEGHPQCSSSAGSKARKKINRSSYVTAHLKHTESHVGQSMFGEKSINLTKLHGNIFSGNDWKKSISEAVMGELHKSTVPANNYYD
jgi:hypothetical protein